MTERIKIVTNTIAAIVVSETNRLLENGFEILSEHTDAVHNEQGKLVPLFTVFLIERMTR